MNKRPIATMLPPITTVMAVLCLCSVSVGQEPAPPEEAEATEAPKADPEALYAEGIKLFDKRDFVAAAAAFLKAYEADNNPFLAYNAGRAYENNGELDKARSWFEKALSEDPPPEVRTLAEDGVIRLDRMEATFRDRQASKKGMIGVGAEEPVDVFVNDKLAGRTPLELELSPGTYDVRAVRPGSQDYTTTVVLDPGETERITAVFESERGLFTAVGWTGVGLLGAGTASVLGGAVFAGRAQSDFDAAESLTPAEIRAGTAFGELKDSGETSKSFALGLYGMGGALMAAGGALILYDFGTAPEEAPAGGTSWNMSIGPAWAGVAGRF